MLGLVGAPFFLYLRTGSIHLSRALSRSTFQVPTHSCALSFHIYDHVHNRHDDTHAHTHTHTQSRAISLSLTHTHTHTHAHTHTHTHNRIHTHTHTTKNTNAHSHTHTHTHTNTYIYIYIYNVCVYLYKAPPHRLDTLSYVEQKTFQSKLAILSCLGHLPASHSTRLRASPTSPWPVRIRYAS